MACKNAKCGDGYVWAGVEECDDGNQVNTDGCVACKNAKCGDGYVWAGVEECDDGNQVGGDGCSATCTVEPICGNSVCDAGEDSCSCPQDCPDDPNSCSPCECGGGGGACFCDTACVIFGDCCWNGPC